VYNAAVYKPINGSITHQKQQVSDKCNTTQQYIA